MYEPELKHMTISAPWRDSYRNALRACGDKIDQESKADIAVDACIERLGQIVAQGSPEGDHVRTALADLRILKALYRKYG